MPRIEIEEFTGCSAGRTTSEGATFERSAKLHAINLQRMVIDDLNRERNFLDVFRALLRGDDDLIVGRGFGRRRGGALSMQRRGSCDGHGDDRNRHDTDVGRNCGVVMF